ncbi:MAG TPA: DNA polymerase IV [Candidatus Edwardsbacteria bacterium]|nr:DNA polymerase IV [Candidatus Edwardsbacteria bacterium]
MDRIIAHVDMDSFFTAVEVLDNPALAGRPVIVGADPKGGKGRGVVSAASYEARRYGVHSAMPISQAYRLCPRGVFLPGRMRRYGELSRRVMAVLGTFTPLVEQVSVDEAFLDLSGCRRLLGQPREMGLAIKRAIRQRTALTASVGIGPNKLVAKIASDLEKPDGLVVVEPQRAALFLRDLPIRRLWGVGPKTEQQLAALGVRTIGDLADLPEGALERRYGEYGRDLRSRARGIDDDPVSLEREEKSLGRETTFDQDTADRRLIAATLLELCDEVAARLRRHGLAGRTVTLKLRYQGFETHTCRRTLASALDETTALYAAATQLWGDNHQPGRKVRLIGVSVSNFAPGGEQTGLFDQPPADRRRRASVERAVDAVRSKFGERALVRAGVLGGDRE